MTIFQRFIAWIKNLFAKKAAHLTVTTRPEPTPVVEVSHTPGLNCPQCGTRMPVSIEALLQAGTVVCPACGLELKVDTRQSAGALSALQRLQDGLEQARKS